MKFRNYVFLFLTGIIVFFISMTQYSSVQASQVISDEIEQFNSPTKEINSPIKEIQINEAVLPDLSVPDSTDIEEQPINNDEEPVEDEKNHEDNDKIQNTTIEKEQTILPTKTTKPKENNLSVPPSKTKENTKVETVSEEAPIPEEVFVPEKEPQINYLSLSKFFDKFSNFLSELWFDKIITLKEAIMRHISSNQFEEDMCCKQITEPKHIANPKDFLPYYFLYPQNHLENIAFNEKINNPKELLVYSYTINNYEVKIDIPKDTITPQGTTDIRVLLNAPSPEIKVAGKSLYAKLVVDIRNNTLYKYDEDGFPLKAYLVATGARGSRTKPGLRIVTHKEKFPYKGAPINTKRIVDPYSYGPYIIFFNIVNPQTGRQSYVDQFLHGNGNEKSIGKKVSHGCMRTNNNVMKNELSKEVNRGDYVLLINPDIK